MIYLDSNATTKLLPAAREAMLDAMEGGYNPSSIHAAGRAAKQRLDTARRIIAESVSAFPNEVIFCATGSEANALALHGVTVSSHFVSAIEHPSVLASVPSATRLKVDANGIVDLAALEASLPTEGRVLVSVMLANNETGVIQPITDIARIVHAAGHWLHVDAVQALGKIPVDMGILGADLLTICAHKLGGPVGAAALVVRQDIPLKAIFPGGGQEMRRRAGTENLPAIAGFAAAVKNAPDLREHRTWLDEMEQRLSAQFPALRIAGAAAARLPNTSCIALPGIKNDTQLMHLDLSNICISAGSACSSGRMEPSPVLMAMGWNAEDAGSAIRISTGWHNTPMQIAAFEHAWLSLANRLRPSAA